jgi:hypothetical protein
MIYSLIASVVELSWFGKVSLVGCKMPCNTAKCGVEGIMRNEGYQQVLRETDMGGWEEISFALSLFSFIPI